jgi:arsenite-transporting ATPase
MSHRLYIVTGKGGVGKSTLALSLAKKLSTEGRKVLYNSFDQEDQSAICNEQGIPFIHFDLLESAKIYMGKKLNSEMVASWIMKTPFFKSLFNMIPGLGHMILLGHIIDLLEDDPELTIVLDSPSSGHALTMFESSHNFKEIFGSGLLVEDIKRMHDFIYRKGILKNYIVSLPTKMSLQESKEVIEHLKGLKFEDTYLVVNDCLSPILNTDEELPEFLNTKKSLEDSVISEFEDQILVKIPHSLGENFKKVLTNLTETEIGKLL